MNRLLRPLLIPLATFSAATTLSLSPSAPLPQCSSVPTPTSLISSVKRSTLAPVPDETTAAIAATLPAVVNLTIQVQSYTRKYRDYSAGSGFIITPTGLVVTNAHVVAVAGTPNPRIYATLSDGRKIPATVHSLDKLSDIALVQLAVDPYANYPTCTLGTSSSLQSGTPVIALGSPLHLQNTCTAGIVSSPARHSSEIGLNTPAEFIQTDASVNQGNSGGPLINLRSEVIGVCTMTAQNVDGISFAIPIDAAWEVVKSLIKDGRHVRPKIGFKMVTVMNRKRETRVLITDVETNSPAARAGVMTGDYVVSCKKKDVTTTRDLLGLLGGVEREIELVVERRGKGRVPIRIMVEV